MVNSLLREQEFPWSRVNTGRPLDNVWFSISVRTMLFMQEGGMFVTNWVRSCGFPRHHVGFAAGRRSRVYHSINNKLVLVRSLRWLEVDGLECLVRYGMAAGMEPSSSKSARSRCPSAVRVLISILFSMVELRDTIYFDRVLRGGSRNAPARAGL